jgi:hypothetical protein
MLNWKTFGVDENQLDGESKLIVERLGSDLTGFFKKTQRKQTTQIMDTLAMLGKDGLQRGQGYKVMTNKISPYLRQGYKGRKKSPAFPSRYRAQFKKVEWLYDLHWYEENEDTPYQQTSFPLVVECEWAYRRPGCKYKDSYGAVKWDFQKLLVANSDLRLMIFKKRKRFPKGKECDDLLSSDYFKQTIDGYKNLCVNSKFLFIAFDAGAKVLHYAEYPPKRRSNAGA